MTLDYLEAALFHKSDYEELRVKVPTERSIYSDELRADSSANTLENFLKEVVAAYGKMPAYMQILSIAYNRPGFVSICVPNGDLPFMQGMVQAWTFSLKDLEPYYVDEASAYRWRDWARENPLSNN